MNKKIIIAGMLFSVLVNAGCNSFVARKDSRQIVKFKDLELNKNIQDVTLYDIKNPSEGDYEEFTTLLSKMAVHKKDINLIIPLDFYQDLENLKNKKLQGEELTFKKYSYLLNEEEKETIDRLVDVDYPTNVGSVQKYLNKQVAYWYRYLNMADKYNSKNYYTEFDKDRIIENIFSSKKDMIELFEMENEDIIVAASSDKLESIKDISNPIYLEIEGDTSGLAKKLESIKSKVIIVNREIDSDIVAGKILLVQGKIVENMKNYRINTVVKEIENPLSLVEVLGEDSGLKVKDMENYSIKTLKSLSQWRSE